MFIGRKTNILNAVSSLTTEGGRIHHDLMTVQLTPEHFTWKGVRNCWNKVIYSGNMPLLTPNHTLKHVVVLWSTKELGNF